MKENAAKEEEMARQLVEAPTSEEVREYKMLIGGEWVEARSGKTFESINPYTGRVWATAPEADEEDVDRAVRASKALNNSSMPPAKPSMRDRGEG